MEKQYTPSLSLCEALSELDRLYEEDKTTRTLKEKLPYLYLPDNKEYCQSLNGVPKIKTSEKLDVYANLNWYPLSNLSTIDIDLHQPGIYIIRQKDSLQLYIGQSVDIAKRLIDHQSVEQIDYDADSPFLHRAIKKYSSKAFEFAVLHLVDISQYQTREALGEDLDKLEQTEVELFGTYAIKQNYNLKSGGNTWQSGNRAVLTAEEVYRVLALVYQGMSNKDILSSVKIPGLTSKVLNNIIHSTAAIYAIDHQNFLKSTGYTDIRDNDLLASFRGNYRGAGVSISHNNDNYITNRAVILSSNETYNETELLDKYPTFFNNQPDLQRLLKKSELRFTGRHSGSIAEVAYWLGVAYNIDTTVSTILGKGNHGLNKSNGFTIPGTRIAYTSTIVPVTLSDYEEYYSSDENQQLLALLRNLSANYEFQQQQKTTNVRIPVDTNRPILKLSHLTNPDEAKKAIARVNAYLQDNPGDSKDKAYKITAKELGYGDNWKKIKNWYNRNKNISSADQEEDSLDAGSDKVEVEPIDISNVNFDDIAKNW